MGIWVDGFSGFGLFTLITNFIGYAGWKSKEAKENKKSFLRTYDPKKNTYLDMYAIERRPNGEYCKTEWSTSGDLVQRNKYNQVVRNISKEKRDRENNLPGTTVLRMSDKDLTISHYNNPCGIRYIDKKTGEEYVIRSFRVPIGKTKAHCVFFYMKTSDATLVRTTDGENKYGTLKDRDIIDEFIENFNQIQKTKKYYSVEQRYKNSDCHNEDRTPRVLY